MPARVERVEKGAEVILAKPGAMSGEIWIGPDFDSLPEDMADAFGMTHRPR